MYFKHSSLNPSTLPVHARPPRSRCRCVFIFLRRRRLVVSSSRRLVPIDRRPDVDRANARGGEAIDGGSRGETETSERREKRVVESTRGGDAG
jgi:hypothetical protein